MTNVVLELELPHGVGESLQDAGHSGFSVLGTLTVRKARRPPDRTRHNQYL